MGIVNNLLGTAFGKVDSFGSDTSNQIGAAKHRTNASLEKEQTNDFADNLGSTDLGLNQEQQAEQLEDAGMSARGAMAQASALGQMSRDQAMAGATQQRFNADTQFVVSLNKSACEVVKSV